MKYIDENFAKTIYKRRKTDAHKGNFGKVLIFAGSLGMAGAAILSGRAALQSGAGLVQFLIPDPDDPIYPILQTAVPEATCVFYNPDMDFSSYTSITVGSGLGKSGLRKNILSDIIKRYGRDDSTDIPFSDSAIDNAGMTLKDASAISRADDSIKNFGIDASNISCIADTDNTMGNAETIVPDNCNLDRANNIHKKAKTLVLDADALNLISEDDKLKISLINSSVNAIITPHVGEAKRLLHTNEEIKSMAQREVAVAALSDEYNCISVLKGSGTLVCQKCGNYFDIRQNTTGNPGMATAGSGDTLSGIIASLSGQGYSSFDAACLGVYIHGKAGDLAAENISQEGITAGDIGHYVPYTFKF